jgi:hypothetical protein
VQGSTYYYDSFSDFPPSRSRRSNDAYYFVYVVDDGHAAGSIGTEQVRLDSPIYTSTGGC